MPLRGHGKRGRLCWAWTHGVRTRTRAPGLLPPGKRCPRPAEGDAGSSASNPNRADLSRAPAPAPQASPGLALPGDQPLPVFPTLPRALASRLNQSSHSHHGLLLGPVVSPGWHVGGSETFAARVKGRVDGRASGSHRQVHSEQVIIPITPLLSSPATPRNRLAPGGVPKALKPQGVFCWAHSSLTGPAVGR